MSGGEARFVHIEFVGIDCALHDRLAQPVARRDENYVAEPGFGVECEHDARRPEVTPHHALHTHRQRDEVVIEVLVDAIGNRTVAKQRGIDFVNGCDDVIEAGDIEKRCLLTGKGCFRRVFDRRGGADCDFDVFSFRQRTPRFADGVPE